MYHLEPKMIGVEEFCVAGLSVRTLNRDEFNSDTAKLPAFWEHYISSGQAEKTMNRVPDSPIYGVYSHYESDANGFYKVTAGVQVIQKENAPGINFIEIKKGNYLC
ncbi:GyrI-like domain-containing protein, partial [uncultured Legionella sp.]|uniref:GyrI-like domain-containing protein n=1 Tax=uncultured Legionella sp. TaxID=210934 RepID=UPI0026111632